MKFSCDACSARYFIDDDKVQGKVLRIRCKKCGNIMTVRENVAPTTSAGAPDVAHAQRATMRMPSLNADSNLASLKAKLAEQAKKREEKAKKAPAQEKWYYSVAGESFGPYVEDELVDRFSSGKIGDDAYVWRQGFDSWKPAATLPVFSAAISRASQRPAPPKGSPSTMRLDADEIRALRIAKTSAERHDAMTTETDVVEAGTGTAPRILREALGGGDTEDRTPTNEAKPARKAARPKKAKKAIRRPNRPSLNIPRPSALGTGARKLDPSGSFRSVDPRLEEGEIDDAALDGDFPNTGSAPAGGTQVGKPSYEAEDTKKRKKDTPLPKVALEDEDASPSDTLDRRPSFAPDDEIAEDDLPSGADDDTTPEDTDVRPLSFREAELSAPNEAVPDGSAMESSDAPADDVDHHGEGTLEHDDEDDEHAAAPVPGNRSTTAIVDDWIVAGLNRGETTASAAVAQAPVSPTKKSRSPLIIGAIIALVLVVGAVVVLSSGTDEEETDLAGETVEDAPEGETEQAQPEEEEEVAEGSEGPDMRPIDAELQQVAMLRAQRRLGTALESGYDAVAGVLTEATLEEFEEARERQSTQVTSATIRPANTVRTPTQSPTVGPDDGSESNDGEAASAALEERLPGSSALPPMPGRPTFGQEEETSNYDGPPPEHFAEGLRTFVQSSIQRCNSRQLTEEGELGQSRIVLEITVQPSGRVSDVGLDRELRDTAFDRCLQGHSDRWLFDRFRGEAVTLQKTYVLQ